MKNHYLFLILFLGLTNCILIEKEETPDPSSEPFVAKIPKLNRPDVILNELAKGEFHHGAIDSITLFNPIRLPKKWHFEAIENFNKIKRITLKMDYGCEDTKFNFVYNGYGQESLIEEIVSVRENYCSGNIAKWVYKYNYEEGLLVSITGKSYFTSGGIESESDFFCDNYFSYYPNGKIETIYSSFRNPRDTGEYGFQKISFVYNSKGNIIEVTREEFENSQYDQKYTFDYDESINPLKNIYIISSVQATLPSYGTLAPRFLSENCVKSIKSEYLYQSKAPAYEHFSYKTVANRVIEFGSIGNIARGIKYEVNYAN